MTRERSWASRSFFGRAWRHAERTRFGVRRRDVVSRDQGTHDSSDASPTGYGALLKEYARLARRYDRRWSFYIEAGVGETTRRLDLKPTDRLLDVGCGTGALLHVLSHSFPAMQLAGIDPSPEMLSVARQKLGASVELQVAWAEGIPYPNDLFDVVVSCSVFHYLRQPVVALKEMLRVLRPGGSLVITDWCDDYLACRVCDGALRVLSAAHFRTYRERECRELLQAAGVGAVLTERYRINWLWGLMTAKGRKSPGVARRALGAVSGRPARGDRAGVPAGAER